MHYDAFGRHSDPPRTYFLEGLPDLGVPSHYQSRRKQRKEADPLREAARRLPQWGDHWPEVLNRFNAARDQVFMYFTDPKIKDYWREQIMQVAASARSTRLFPELPDWSDDKAKVYAAMAICTQVFTHEPLIPKSIQETEWYKLNHDVYGWVRARDAAPGWMMLIEQDLRERSLLDHVGKAETAGSPNGKLPDAGNAQTEPTPVGVAGGAARGGSRSKAELVRDGVFISYSHKDKKWLDELQDHLKPYTRKKSVTIWSDEAISPGQEWFAQIKAALASVKVAVLLVSKDFLASEFIAENELRPLLEQARTGVVHIIWIPLGACSYEETELKDLQAAIDPDKPLEGMRKWDRDKAWVKICGAIKEAVNR